jgi:hypothetical protein
MRQRQVIIDEEKIGKKGYPRCWKEHGFAPPTTFKEINIRETNLQNNTEKQDEGLSAIP